MVVVEEAGVNIDRSPVADPDGSDGEVERLRADNARLAAALAQAERRGTLLQAELHHQVRNALAIVESVVRRTARTSDTLEYYTTHLDGRLAAIRRNQKLASFSAGGGGIGLDFLLAEEFLTHGAHEGQLVDLFGPEIELRGVAASSLGLAFHELAVNSLKFGALSTPQGRIAVTWTVEGRDGERQPAGHFLRLEWIESGCLLPPDLPRRRGFGTELIQSMLAYHLGAEASLDFGMGGLRCTISLPFSEDVRNAS